MMYKLFSQPQGGGAYTGVRFIRALNQVSARKQARRLFPHLLKDYNLLLIPDDRRDLWPDASGQATDEAMRHIV